MDCPVYHQAEIFKEIFSAVFTTYYDIDFILFALPNDVPMFDPLTNSFDVLQEREQNQSDEKESFHNKFFFFSRTKFGYNPKLNVRKAREEDHDDLTELLKRKQPHLFQQNGDFFLAKLLKQQDEDNKVLVALVDGIKKGVMCLTASSDDIGEITASYEMEPYSHFMKTENGKKPQKISIKGSHIKI